MNNKRTIKARKILQLDPLELWDLIVGKAIPVMFDDGVVVLPSTEIILSAYAWQIHKKYTKLPLTKDMVVSSFYKNGIASKDCLVPLLQALYRNTLEVYDIHDSEDSYKLAEVILRINNDLYNASFSTTARYITGSNVMEAILLHDNPKMRDIKNSLFDVEINEGIMSECIDDATEILVTNAKNPDGSVNYWSWMATRGLVKAKQLLLIVGFLRYVTDIDGTTIDYPVLYSYLGGIRTYSAYNIMARENADAVNSAQDDLRKASTDSRRMTYASSYKRKVIPGDCGTTEFILLHVEDQKYLNMLNGSMMNRANNPPIAINPSMTHLIGKTLQIRSQFTCAIQDPHIVCSSCVGRLSTSIPAGGNMGADIARRINQIIIQLKLSRKHHIDQSTGVGGTTDKVFKAVFREKPQTREIYIRDVHVHGAVKVLLYIPNTFTNNRLVTMQESVKNVQLLTLAQTSRIDYCNISIQKSRKLIEHEDINTCIHEIPPMFTYGVLEFLNTEYRSGRDRITAKGDMYEVDLTGYDFDKPIMRRPNTAPDSDRDNKHIISLYERIGVKEEHVTDSILETLHEILRLSIKGNLKVTLSAIETILSAYICDDGSFNLARGFTNTYHASALQVLRGRSIAMYLILKSQKDTIAYPSAYLLTNRDDSTLDGIYDPVGLMKANKVRPTALQEKYYK